MAGQVSRIFRQVPRVGLRRVKPISNKSEESKNEAKVATNCRIFRVPTKVTLFEYSDSKIVRIFLTLYTV